MVLIAVVRHQIQPGKMRQAADRIRSNGDRMRAQPGFVSRQLLAASDGSDELATTTVWESTEAYEAWVAHNKTAGVHAGSESPYVGSPMSSLFHEYEQEVGSG